MRMSITARSCGTLRGGAARMRRVVVMKTTAAVGRWAMRVLGRWVAAARRISGGGGKGSGKESGWELWSHCWCSSAVERVRVFIRPDGLFCLHAYPYMDLASDVTRMYMCAAFPIMNPLSVFTCFSMSPPRTCG